MMPMTQDRTTGIVRSCSEPLQEPIRMVPSIHNRRWHGWPDRASLPGLQGLSDGHDLRLFCALVYLKYLGIAVISLEVVFFDITVTAMDSVFFPRIHILHIQNTCFTPLYEVART